MQLNTRNAIHDKNLGDRVPASSTIVGLVVVTGSLILFNDETLNLSFYFLRISILNDLFFISHST